MKRRVYMKNLFIFIKIIFWITFTYGIVLLSSISQDKSGFSTYQVGKYKQQSGSARVYYNTAGSLQNAAGISISKCSRMALPSWMAEKEKWQPIDKSRSMYSFSAYFVKDRSTVFIVGVRPRNKVNLICQFWKRTQEGYVELASESEADARALLDDFGYRFAPTIFECFVNIKSSPQYISLSTRHCETPTNILEIQNATKRSNFNQQITVCVPPLIFHYNKSAEFIRWVEINRQLGVDKFVVYNYSSGSHIDHVLTHYSKRGLVEVIQWRPPMVNDDLPSEIKPVELGSFGRTAALNDCLYRSKSTSEYITNIGVNEYILPQFNNESTINEMLAKLETNYAVYHVTRAVSRTQSKMIGNVINSSFQNDHQKSSIKYTTKLNNKINSRKLKLEISSGDELKKLIIRTPEVDFTSVHEVPGVNIYFIPSWKAVFHKNSEFGNSYAIERDSVIPLKIIYNANKNVKNVLNNLKT